MINVLEKVREEAADKPDYEDEGIASDIYYISLSTALRELDKITDEEVRKKKEDKNEWLKKESVKIQDIPVLDMDNIKKALKLNGKSCDGLFYNYKPQENEQHYLVELKNTGKKNLLSLMQSKGDDGILYKVKDSLQMIRSELEFGGTQEKEEIIKNMHFFMIYGGKNDIPSKNGSIKLPQRTKVQGKAGQKKQSRAGKMDYHTQKKENDIYTLFGKSISEMGLQACNEKDFPGDALPHTKRKGKEKIREFSIFSAHDFAEIVEKGFFDNWNWGEYQQYLKAERMDE